MSALMMGGDKAVTMTSLELVDFINSQRGQGDAELRHDHFMAKVPKVLGEDHAPKFRGMIEVTVGKGATRQSPIFRLPKREACLMAMSYSYDLQAKVFDRMTELETRERLGLPDFTDPAASAMAWAEQFKAKQVATEKAKVLEAKVEEDAPKVEFFHKVTIAPGAITLAETSKILGTGRTRLSSWMRQIAWLRRNNEPYQDRIEAGLLDVKLSSWEHPDYGMQRSVTALVTGKGLAKLQRLWQEAQHQQGMPQTNGTTAAFLNS